MNQKNVKRKKQPSWFSRNWKSILLTAIITMLLVISGVIFIGIISENSNTSTFATVRQDSLLQVPQNASSPDGEIGNDFYAGKLDDQNNNHIGTKEKKVVKSPQVKKLSFTEVQSSVNKLSSIALTAAQQESEFVPAGVTLTMMIMGAEMGKQLSPQNLQKIITLLQETKKGASEKDRKAYFQFAANTNKWFEGLQMEKYGNYDIGQLLRIYEEYNLAQYDKQVLDAINTKKKEFEYTRIEPKTEAPAMKGDASDEEVRRNYAFAKNRWTEKEAKGTPAEVKFIPAEKPTTSQLEKIRKQVRGLKNGEQLEFSNPAEYHIALKELIAFEKGYGSWEDYLQQNKKSAEKEFRKRSEAGGIFGSGNFTIQKKIAS